MNRGSEYQEEEQKSSGNMFQFNQGSNDLEVIEELDEVLTSLAPDRESELQ
jgi:hypothetical protein